MLLREKIVNLEKRFLAEHLAGVKLLCPILGPAQNNKNGKDFSSKIPQTRNFGISLNFQNCSQFKKGFIENQNASKYWHLSGRRTDATATELWTNKLQTCELWEVFSKCTFLTFPAHVRHEETHIYYRDSSGSKFSFIMSWDPNFLAGGVLLSHQTWPYFSTSNQTRPWAQDRENHPPQDPAMWKASVCPAGLLHLLQHPFTRTAGGHPTEAVNVNPRTHPVWDDAGAGL